MKFNWNKLDESKDACSIVRRLPKSYLQYQRLVQEQTAEAYYSQDTLNSSAHLACNAVKECMLLDCDAIFYDGKQYNLIKCTTETMSVSDNTFASFLYNHFIFSIGKC